MKIKNYGALGLIVLFSACHVNSPEERAQLEREAVLRAQHDIALKDSEELRKSAEDLRRAAAVFDRAADRARKEGQ
jgi:hypothetical protein